MGKRSLFNIVTRPSRKRGRETKTTEILTENPVLTLTEEVTEISCNGANDASVTLTAIGGTIPYSYAWNTNPIQNTDSAINLSVGNYTITVTDDNDCTVETTVTIADLPGPTATTSSTDANCGQADGSVTVIVSGGTPIYTYLWNDGLNQTTATANNSPNTA